jgi:uncharacterized YigZ family protein
MARYRVPTASAEGEVKEKGSRFLAVVEPVADETAARGALDALRHRYADATHVCWAWRIGVEGRERSSDAGEPSGTAGVPILRVLAGRGLSDVLAVVVRWFGGTKLGKGGLARAYAAAVKAAIEHLPTAEVLSKVRLQMELPYELHGAVQRLVHPPEVALVAEDYGEQVRLTIEVEEQRLAAVEEALASLGIEPRRGGD